MCPDSKLFVEKLKKESVEAEVIVGEGMPHIWPFLPLMSESRIALSKISEIINGIQR
jgi:acetyl esterase/lipase